MDSERRNKRFSAETQSNVNNVDTITRTLPKDLQAVIELVAQDENRTPDDVVLAVLTYWALQTPYRDCLKDEEGDHLFLSEFEFITGRPSFR